MEKIIEEEQKYLQFTLRKFKEIIENTELRLQALPRMYRDNPVLLSNLMLQFQHKLDLLNKIQGRPYFARIDFKDEEEQNVEKCYIGKVGIFDDDNNIVTIDWRSPIASLYYDSNIGRASYEAPKGIINGDLLIKRQYEIDNQELKGFQDVDTVSNDEMLKPYLGTNADSRLKNIVATIQSEQNDIIRKKINNNLIIQGVAGSGKTTVALHRIAYLVYNNMKNIKPNQYLVIGPNKFFVNYISGVLPDLDVDNVSQLTYDEIVKELICDDFCLVTDEEKLKKSISAPDKMIYDRLKVSMSYKEALDNFLMDFDETIVPKNDFSIKEYNILPQSFIKKVYSEISCDDVIDYSIIAKKIDRANLIIGKYIEEHYEEILASIHKQFHEKVSQISKNMIEKERKNQEFVEKELKNKCNQSLKKYFSNGTVKISSLYVDFLKKIKNYISIDENGLELFNKKTLNNIKNKMIEFEDLSALIYLFYRVYGPGDFERYRHTVIDEAQDFGEFNFYALKKIMPNCTFSIFGDLSQSIYQYRGITKWEDVIKSSFDGECDLKCLKKSYRTTTEIMNSANYITSFINYPIAEPVIRHGVDVEYSLINDNKEQLILDYVNDYIMKGYKSIAIICKDEVEINTISDLLKSMGLQINIISNSDMEYKGGICVITNYLAKGLEFDGVIISNASEEYYNSSKIIDMKLLYVAMTRPLHELKVLYNGEITFPLRNKLNKDKLLIKTPK